MAKTKEKMIEIDLDSIPNSSHYENNVVKPEKRNFNIIMLIEVLIIGVCLGTTMCLLLIHFFGA